MRVAVFSSKAYDQEFLERANREFDHDLVFLPMKLDRTTCALAGPSEAVCAFVNDRLDRTVLTKLADAGTKVIALRSAGYNHVDIEAAQDLGLHVVRVPAYSPHAVAEHTLALILALNRHIPRAHARVRDGNFSLDGLMGFDLCGKTVGVIGTGKIGSVVAHILKGFGCAVVAFDIAKNNHCIDLGVEYISLRYLLEVSDIITLHCPLTPETLHIIDAEALQHMKSGAMLINTSRGGLLDTDAVIKVLKSGNLGALGIDVYEEEGDLFFEDLSGQVLTDDTFARLLTFPNVLITGHQAFFTKEAVTAIAETTLQNIADIETTRQCVNDLTDPPATHGENDRDTSKTAASA